MEKVVAWSLSRLLLSPSDLKPDELRRCCERAFSVETARTFLVDPTKKWPDEVSRSIDSQVLRVLHSTESTPIEKADSLHYLLNPESLARIRTEAIVAIEKILNSMSNDEVLRSADTKWHPLSQDLTRSFSERVKEYEGMFKHTIAGYSQSSFSISVLRIVSAANLTSELALPLRELAKSCLKSIQPIAPKLLALRINSVELSTGETHPGIYSLRSKPLAWKKDLCTFHMTLRLLQSNKLADIKDFVPGEPIEIDSKLWGDATSVIRNRDSDNSDDLDQREFGSLGEIGRAHV